MPYCEDCGTKLSDGICQNCQEELFIYDNQMDIDEMKAISKEFGDKVQDQINHPKTGTP